MPVNELGDLLNLFNMAIPENNANFIRFCNFRLDILTMFYVFYVKKKINVSATKKILQKEYLKIFIHEGCHSRCSRFLLKIGAW